MRPATFVLPFVIVAASSGAALAGPALDDPAQKPADGSTPAAGTAAAPEEPAAPEVATEYGIGIRLRDIILPHGIIQPLFVARAPGGVENVGIGAELTRRRGNSELQLGFEYEHVNPAEGIWIQKGHNVPGDEADYILNPEHSTNNFGWFTIELTFFSHAKLTDWMSFRYGAGLGLGILTGEVDHYNIACASGSTNDNPAPGCTPPRFGGRGTYTDPQPGVQVQVAYDTPPVFPVLNAIIGLQFKPMDKMTFNLEMGIRTLPFIGMDASYFF